MFPPSPGEIGALANIVCPPLGIAHLAAYLADRYEVSILDATVEGAKTITRYAGDEVIWYGLTAQQTVARIAVWKPNVIGISTLYSSQFPIVRRIVAALKRVLPNTFIVIGGSHATFMDVNSLQTTSEIDVAVRGEGEIPLRTFLEAIENGGDLASVKGITYRKNGEIIRNPRAPRIDNLDELPLPARHLIPLEKYYRLGFPWSPHHPNTSLMTSRGCPEHCTFCSSHRFWHKGIRMRSARNVIEELLYLKEEYGIREVQFYDDNITADRDRAVELFNLMLSEKLEMGWETPGGLAAWTLDDELIDLMIRSRCRQVAFGVESVDSEYSKKVLQKKYDMDRDTKLISKLQAGKVLVNGFFIVGFPDETKQQIDDTLAMARKLPFDFIQIFIATPFPGTPLYTMCRRKGLIDDSYDIEKDHYFASVFDTSAYTSEELLAKVHKVYVVKNYTAWLMHPLLALRLARQALFHPLLTLKNLFKRILSLFGR